ncbi:MAG: 16S rRNA processing protein RimM [Salinarimonas sp.]|nr:16S rRNA processing protein RimM [Salinarimonas sp.]
MGAGSKRRGSRPPAGLSRRAQDGRSSAPAPAAPVSALPEDAVRIGECGRAHGLHGEVRLKSFTEDPAMLAEYLPLFDEGGVARVITAMRPAPGGASDLFIARIEGVDDRNAAEALNRRGLYTTRAALATIDPPEEDEFLLADLIGLEAVTPDGEIRGTVVEVPDYGAGTLIGIAPVTDGQGQVRAGARGETVLLPFTKVFFPEIDIAGGRIIVDAPDDVFTPSTDDAPPPEEA